MESHKEFVTYFILSSVTLEYIIIIIIIIIIINLFENFSKKKDKKGSGSRKF